MFVGTVVVFVAIERFDSERLEVVANGEAAVVEIDSSHSS